MNVAAREDRRLDVRGWPIPNALDPAFFDPESGRRYLLMFVFACETGKTVECYDWTVATSEPFRGGVPPACPHCKQDMTGRRPPYRQFFEQDEPIPPAQGLLF